MNTLPTDPTRDWLQSAFDEHEGPLMRYALRLSGDLERARDAVQEAFLRLGRESAGTLRERVRPWLFVVCRNQLLDRVREDHRIIPMEPRDLEQHGGHDLTSPSAGLESRETGSQLARLVNALPAAQREAVRLRFESGLSYQEIADVMDTTTGNVGSLLHTALQTLRARMAREAA
jgi:RNA polymerase sigma-70 factor (ECF subfamily)